MDATSFWGQRDPPTPYKTNLFSSTDINSLVAALKKVDPSITRKAPPRTEEPLPRAPTSLWCAVVKDLRVDLSER